MDQLTEIRAHGRKAAKARREGDEARAKHHRDQAYGMAIHADDERAARDEFRRAYESRKKDLEMLWVWQ